MQASFTRINVAVAVADDSVGRIEEVEAACRKLGFRHGYTLPQIGVFTGSVELANLAKLRAMADIIAVEIERRPRLNACQGVAARCSVNTKYWSAAAAAALAGAIRSR